MQYTAIIEPTATGFSAYVPDLPGCVASAPTREAVEHELRQAVQFHVDGLRSEGLSVPTPSTIAELVEAT
jgi:predicted RNase H-like HicB family nuclease